MTDNLMRRSEAEVTAYQLAAEKLAEELQIARERIDVLALEVVRLRAALAAQPDAEPQPNDGPDYHADHDAWNVRKTAAGSATPEENT